MPGVPRCHAAGTQGPGGIGRRTGEQIVQLGVHRELRPGVPLDENIGVPQLLPGSAVFRQQTFKSCTARRFRQLEVGARVPAPTLAREGHELAERVGLVLAHLYAEVYGQPVRALVKGYRLGHQARAQSNGRCLSHAQPLLCLAVQPQCHRAGITLARRHMRVAGIPDRCPIGCRGRYRLEALPARRHDFFHLRAAELGERQAGLVRCPEIKSKGELHGAVEIWRDRQPARRQMRSRLIDEGCDLDGRACVSVDVVIVCSERRLVQVQRLLIVLETGWLQRRPIEPSLPGRTGARAVIDLCPPWNSSGPRHVVTPVVHESHQIGRLSFRSAGPAQRRDVTVGEVGGKITDKILIGSGQQEARIGVGPRGSGQHSQQ